MKLLLLFVVYFAVTHTHTHNITKTENVSMSDQWSDLRPGEDVRCRCWWAFFPLKSLQSSGLPASRLMAARWWAESNLIMHFSDAGGANILHITDIDSLLALRWFPEDDRDRQGGRPVIKWRTDLAGCTYFQLLMWQRLNRARLTYQGPSYWHSSKRTRETLLFHPSEFV